MIIVEWLDISLTPFSLFVSLLPSFVFGQLVEKAQYVYVSWLVINDDHHQRRIHF